MLPSVSLLLPFTIPEEGTIKYERCGHGHRRGNGGSHRLFVVPWKFLSLAGFLRHASSFRLLSCPFARSYYFAGPRGLQGICGLSGLEGFVFFLEVRGSIEGLASMGANYTRI